MLTHIVRNAPALCAFLDQLELGLSKPQRQHLLDLADGLLVCDSTKTLAALQRQFLDAVDPSNLADFLRISPWSVADVRAALRTRQVAWALEEAQRLGLPKVLSLNLDDSLGVKNKDTRHVEPVAWFHDHNASTKGRPRYQNGFCYLECTLRIGPIVVTTDLRLYLRAETVRRLNRHRPPENRLAFRSKNRLARSILAALQPLLPQDWTVFVQFDSWYASQRLIRYVRRQGWQVTCALKSNRLLQSDCQPKGKPLRQLASAFKHRRYTRVRVFAADGSATTYYVRETTGRLAGLPFEVRVLFSKRHPEAKVSAYFLSTDFARTVEQTLQGYGGRWSCEVVNFYVKTQLGLADFRVRSCEAVDKYLVVVQLAWAYVERRFVVERSAQIKCPGDVIRRHRDEHAEAWLMAAVQMALATGNAEAVRERFLHPAA